MDTVFFAMSGFLVTPSLARSRSVSRFALKRLARLCPALAVSMVGMVFVIGPLSTRLDVLDYLTDRSTWSFLITELNRTTDLPGVFVDTPLSKVVNGSLWTLKFEALSYMLLAGVGYTRLLDRPFVILLFTLAVMAVTAVLFHEPVLLPKEVLLLRFVMLFEFFMAGVVLATIAHRVAVSWPLLIVAAVITAIAIVTGWFFIVGPITMTYLVIGFGVQPKIDVLAKLLSSGDYSYGIYLWAFPIQQIVQETVRTTHWFGNVLVALPVTVLLAAVSWHVVEKPSLDFVNAGLSRVTAKRSEPRSATMR